MMKNRILALLLALSLTLSVLTVGACAETAEEAFTDVATGKWYYTYVDSMYQLGLMAGMGNGTFQPETTLTRAMFVTILGRLAGIDPEEYTASTFTDVVSGSWYAPYVAWAQEKGIAAGYSDGTFGINDPVTRQQMAAFIHRYLTALEILLPEAEEPAQAFGDAATVSSYATEAVELMRQTGLISGFEDGNFYPNSTATRAQAASIFLRLKEAIDSSFTWWLDEQNVLHIHGSGSMEVWSLGTNTAPWLDSRSEITGIVVEEGITKISAYAFYKCTNATFVSLPSTVTGIGKDAFGYCKALTSIDLPDGVTGIDEYAFYGCSQLTAIVIPEGVTTIGSFAFGYCSALVRVQLSEALTSLGSKAFYGCTALTDIVIPDGITTLKSNVFAHCYALTSITLPAGLTAIGQSAFYSCSALEAVWFGGSQEQWDAISMEEGNSCLTEATIYFGVS